MNPVIFLPCAFAVLFIAALSIALWSLKWPRVKGTVLVSIFEAEWNGESSGFNFTMQKKGNLYLAYSYQVGDCEFEAARISPLVDVDWQFFGSAAYSSARDRANRYREGGTVDVSYCPYLPQWSCLEPGGFLVPLALAVVTAITFVIL